MRFYIEEDDVYFDDPEDVVDHCISYDMWGDDSDGFDEYIYNTESYVEILGHEYSPRDILIEMGDYDDALSDWANDQYDSAKENALYDLRHAEPGMHVWIENTRVEVIEDGEDTDGDEEYSEDLVVAQMEAARNAEEMERNENKRMEDAFMHLFRETK